jgi:hypothetical protein
VRTVHPKRQERNKSITDARSAHLELIHLVDSGFEAVPKVMTSLISISGKAANSKTDAVMSC